MKYCEYCNNPIGETPRRSFCSESCYQKDYYYKNKERRKAYYKEYAKRTYVPHPLPKKTPEEWQEYRRNYYLQNRERYKKWNAEHYQKHKNDPHYKARVRRNQANYYERRKLNDI